MGQHYFQISPSERHFIEHHRHLGQGPSWIARALSRPLSTITREIARNRGGNGTYVAVDAASQSKARRFFGPVKLAEGTGLREHVFRQIRKGWSPQQISGTLKRMPDAEQVSHETIYTLIYLLPKGQIRKELIGLLRQGRKLRRPRSQGKDRRGGLKNMTSIHERDPSVLTRETLGHWEGDLIKGAGNASAVGTFVERKSRYIILTKLKNSTADEALRSFGRGLKRVPIEALLTLTYDQGKEMAHHEKLANHLNIKVYFCDPHSPWQRPSNENQNGLVRQYLPKGIDLSIYSQKDLDKIAESLNTRPRACLGFQTPKSVFNKEIINPRVALQI